MRKELAALRARIDRLDARLAPLLARRLALAAAAAPLKKKVRDAARERRVLAAAGRAAGALADPVKAVYSEILKQGRRLQGGR